MNNYTAAIQLPMPPHNWEYSGEYDYLKPNEYHLSDRGVPLKWDASSLVHVKVHKIRQTKWSPNRGEKVWYVSAGLTVESIKYDSSDYHANMYLAGNMYKSESIACLAADAIIDLIKAADFNKIVEY